MQQLKVSGRTAGSVGSAARSRGERVVCQAVKGPDGLKGPLGHLALAVVMGLSSSVVSGPLMVQPAFADEEAELTPLQKRQLEAERRRDLLRQAREKAEQKTQESASQATEAADKAVDESNEVRRVESFKAKLDTKAYDTQAAKSLKAPPANPLENSPLNFSLPPPPEKLSDIKVPDLKSFKFEAPSFEAPKFNFEAPKLPSFDAPKPAEEPPAPKPAPPPPAPPPRQTIQSTPVAPRAPISVTPAPPPPPPAPAPAPVVPVPVPVPVPAPAPVIREEPRQVKPAPEPVKKSEEAKTSGKRKGPLPLFVAQFLVLGLYAGIGVAATRYNAQATQALQTAGKFIVETYNKVEAQIGGKK